MKILINYDFLGNQIQNAVIHAAATAPTALKAGQMYFNTTENTLYVVKTQSGGALAWDKAGVVYSSAQALSTVITGLSIDGTVTRTAIADLVIGEGSDTCTLGDIHELAHSLEDYMNRDGVTVITTTETEDSTVLGTIASPKNMDIAIIKRLIAGTTDKYEVTTYIYDTVVKAWKAADGSYNAENVYFDENITVTTAVGNIGLTNGQGSIPAQGKNLKQVFESIWTKESNPSVTQPSVSISTAAQSKEIGTTVSPSWTATLNAGSYQYGPATGVTATAWSISNNKTSETATTATGSFNDFVITEGNCYSITATATHTKGANPKSNLGNEVASLAIASGTKTVTKNLFTGYKPNFYGYKTSANVIADFSTIDSAVVRALGTNQEATIAPVTSVNIPVAWRQFFYAIPKGRKSALAVKDSNSLPLTVTSREVTVNHVGGVSSTYTVFCINNAADYGATKLTLTWSN